jgi:hypothetical protein
MNRAKVIGAVGGLLLISGLVVNSSTAAFTATTDNTGNSWTAGTVTLTDNDSGTALFSETALKPGSTGSRCIVVTYNGTLAASVKLRGAISAGALGQYLDLTVRRGSGSQVDCTDFTTTLVPPEYTGTVGDLATNHSTFLTGVGTWAPTGAAQSATYQLTWTLQDNNAAQGQSVQAAFTWEAQNT